MSVSVLCVRRPFLSYDHTESSVAAVPQAVGAQAVDLKIIVHPNSTRLILTGSSYSVGLAKDLIAKLDVAEPLVELDTEVYEVDEGSQKQLGLKFPTAALSTTYSELTPQPNASGVSSPINGLQPLGRTPLSLQAQLDFLVSTNHARILEDPRITTFSGRTASLRAGETVNVLTTAGGGSGTVATTQIQSFQTGVTLDITPVVNTNDYVTVTLHPSVNTEAGISDAGVPNIQNRDTTTTVGLHDGETIVVGGLIEDTNSRTVQKIPILGDLPLIGRLFQDVGASHTRNELIVTVTPHILKDGFRAGIINRDLPAVPSGAPLPRLAAEATLPPKRSHAENVPSPMPVAPQAPLIASETPLPRPIPTPAALPSAFSQTNVFTYGSPPPNNYADASQAPQLFFVQAKPTVVRVGQLVTISAVTTSNVSSLTFGSSAADNRQSLGAIGTGKWQGTVTVNPLGTALGSSNVTMFLTATTFSGATVSQQIPFSLEK